VTVHDVHAIVVNHAGDAVSDVTEAREIERDVFERDCVEPAPSP